MTMRERILSAMTPGRGYTVQKLVRIIRTPEDDPYTFHLNVQVVVSQLATADVIYKRRIKDRKFGMPVYTYHRRSVSALRARGLDAYGLPPGRKPPVQGSSQEKVLAAIATLPAEFSPAQLWEALGREQYARVTAVKWLERLEARGHVVRVRRGVYSSAG